MAEKDPNAARKKQILNRAKHQKNTKVVHLLLEGGFLDKLDQAGPHAGAWLEDLEGHFDEVVDEPKGDFRGFKPKDFDDLFMALYGYGR